MSIENKNNLSVDFEYDKEIFDEALVSENFIVCCDSELKEYLKQGDAERMNAIKKNIDNMLGLNWNMKGQKVRVYLFSDKEQYLEYLDKNFSDIPKDMATFDQKTNSVFAYSPTDIEEYKKILGEGSLFDIITIFPKIFNSYLSESILARAQAKNLIDINIHDLRDWAEGAHRQVDDRPFGGGPGMVLKIEPIYKAVMALKRPKTKDQRPKPQIKDKRTRIILLSAKGKTFTQNDAKRLSKYSQIILICGRYEGVDERVAKYVADEEISIGDYVLTGGELPAMIIVDSVSRLIPGVIGKKESLTEESFTIYNKQGKIRYTEYPHYTRPEVFFPDKKTKWLAPKVLISGNHVKIQEWRRKNAKITKFAK